MKVSRNKACPCGSGKKFKACCGKGEKTRAGVKGGHLLAVIIGVAVIGGFAIAINQFRYVDADGTPQPWEYNAARNQDWNPQPGHGHWHDGPPPGGTGQGTQPAADVNPQPWQYDAVRNRHWNPQPGHDHWHDGPPPNQAGSLAPAPTPGVGGLPTLPPLEPATAEVPADGSPAAWDYDAENDKHWNPNTRTWDSGMPPLEAFTSGADN